MSFNNYANKNIDYEIILQNMAYANNRDITASIGNRLVLSPPDQKTVEDYRRRTLPQGVIDPTTGNKTLYRTVQPVAIDTDIDNDSEKLAEHNTRINERINSDNKTYYDYLSVAKEELYLTNKKIDDTKILINDFTSATNLEQLILLKEKYEKILEKKNNSIGNLTSDIIQLDNLINEIDQKMNVFLDDYNESETKINLLETKNKNLRQRVEINKKGRETNSFVDQSIFLHDDQIVESENKISEREQIINELKNKNIFNKINSIKLKEENRPNKEELKKLNNEIDILTKESNDLTVFLVVNSFDNDINNYDQSLEKLNNILDSLIRDREKVNNDIIGLEDRIDTNKNNLQKLESDRLYIEASLMKRKQENKEKVAKYKDDFKELNQGLTNIPVQEPGESDELFYQRLQAYTGQSFTDTDILANVDYRLTLEIKEKFKELFDANNPLFLSIIESVINTPELSTTELKQNFLRRWAQFKIAYLKVYEKDNKFVKPNDIIDLWLETQSKIPIGSVTSTSSSSSSSSSTPLSLEPVDPRDQKDEEKVKEQAFEHVFKFTFDDKNNDSTNIYYIWFPIDTQNNDTRYNIAISITGQIGTFKVIKLTSKSDRVVTRKTLSNELKTYLQNNYSKHLNPLIFHNVLSVLINHILGNYPPDDIDDRLSLSTDKGKIWRQTNLKKAGNGSIIGFGIKMPEVEKFANFGKVVIMLDKLIKTNTLVIKDKRGASILGVRNILVSDHMVNIITKLIADPKADISSDYIELSPADLEIYSALMELSGLHKILKVPKPNIKVYKDKLKVIVGEIEAGNDNLISDLQDCLNKLVALKAITKTEAKRYFNDLTQ
jgi:hypothetical protein